ncbi:helix-turn-helix domain-containing protein [Crossiella sp. CA-258035]|uniref:ArsR/SmtB family transcription factor n=1 Tax=Crossiella sp. CA-258035 TaxID=2981138 RepID=UPI0024BC087B|nr:helix-turn-helix domain-containing protein [Crossiella sp. CA-258035]WHT22461.1 helix-turn-helix domain-containing protein [Crossiella sp. CA-258035]
MVAIGFAAQGVARVRLSVSCLWEVVAGLRVLRGGEGRVLHAPWVARTASPLPDSLLWQLVPAAPHYIPDFLTPPPHTPDLAAELAALRATPAAVVREHLDLSGIPASPEIQALHRDPATGLARLAEEVTAYWAHALAPDWPRIRALLDREVFRGARLLAGQGIGALLNDLHESVRWDGSALTVANSHCRAPNVSDGPGLVLVPSAFVWPSVLSISAGEAPQLAYPARGVATLWETPADTAETLGAVLGRSRARLLAEMSAPTSTTELARRTGMSAGAVSQHLNALRGAGLVASHRAGKGVLSARTALAEALLAGR